MESNNQFYSVKEKRPESIKELHVKNIQKFLRENYSDPSISLTLLGNEFKLNKNYLSNLFYEVSNIKITGYLNYLRINKAKEILIHQPEVPVHKVAASVGYTCSDHFIRVFKKYTSTTPVKYRVTMVSAHEYVELFDRE